MIKVILPAILFCFLTHSYALSSSLKRKLIPRKANHRAYTKTQARADLNSIAQGQGRFVYNKGNSGMILGNSAETGFVTTASVEAVRFREIAGVYRNAAKKATNRKTRSQARTLEAQAKNRAKHLEKKHKAIEKDFMKRTNNTGALAENVTYTQKHESLRVEAGLSAEVVPGVGASAGVKKQFGKDWTGVEQARISYGDVFVGPLSADDLKQAQNVVDRKLGLLDSMNHTTKNPAAQRAGNAATTSSKAADKGKAAATSSSSKAADKGKAAATSSKTSKQQSSSVAKAPDKSKSTPASSKRSRTRRYSTAVPVRGN